MWIEHAKMIMLGFKRSGRSGHTWICTTRYGLGRNAHLTIFTEGRARRHQPLLVEAFHVTLELHHHNLHFYYAEGDPACWEACGHTPSAQLVALGEDPTELMRRSDAVARRFARATGGDIVPFVRDGPVRGCDWNQ